MNGGTCAAVETSWRGSVSMSRRNKRNIGVVSMIWMTYHGSTSSPCCIRHAQKDPCASGWTRDVGHVIEPRWTETTFGHAVGHGFLCGVPDRHSRLRLENATEDALRNFKCSFLGTSYNPQVSVHLDFLS
jgi:hypothetical protein